MEIKIISGVIFFAVIMVVIGLTLPGDEPPPPQTFPWQIERTPGGTTRVFGLTPGESRLREAEQIFNAAAEISLFDPADHKRQRMIEAYFDNVTLGGLSARVVVVVDIAAQQLREIYERGTRISTLGDGSRKVTLHAQDVDFVRASPIASITYLPRIRLETALIERRFGKPAQVAKETDGHMAHWLYPDKGLDIALDEDGNSVLQYVPPSEFAQLLEPLK
jgi:hypothetical protein